MADIGMSCMGLVKDLFIFFNNFFFFSKLKTQGKLVYEINDFTNVNDITQSDILKTNSEEQRSILKNLKNCIKKRMREKNYE